MGSNADQRQDQAIRDLSDKFDRFITVLQGAVGRKEEEDEVTRKFRTDLKDTITKDVAPALNDLFREQETLDERIRFKTEKLQSTLDRVSINVQDLLGQDTSSDEEDKPASDLFGDLTKRPPPKRKFAMKF
jgi:hypothetical protein